MKSESQNPEWWTPERQKAAETICIEQAQRLADAGFDQFAIVHVLGWSHVNAMAKLIGVADDNPAGLTLISEAYQASSEALRKHFAEYGYPRRRQATP